MLTDKGKRYKKKTGKKQKGGGRGASVGLSGKCISPKTLQKNFHYLYAIVKGLRNKQQRDALVDLMTKSQLACIKQMITSFLKGKIQLDAGSMKKLKRDRKYLYSLVRPETPIKTKKKVIKMKGGIFFAPLLGALAPALIGPVAKGIGTVVNEVAKGL